MLHTIPKGKKSFKSLKSRLPERNKFINFSEISKRTLQVKKYNITKKEITIRLKIASIVMK